MSEIQKEASRKELFTGILDFFHSFIDNCIMSLTPFLWSMLYNNFHKTLSRVELIIDLNI